MSLIIYKNRYANSDVINQFRNQYYYCRELKYLASDLLKDGFTTKQIVEAVQKAMSAGRTAGLSIPQHFAPVYTALDEGLVKDCKLSNIGYGLVLLNADVNLPIVAQWQIKVLNNILCNQ